MAVASETRDRAEDTSAPRPPYGAYAVSALNLVVFSAATFKAARTITRDDVTSFLRVPFVEGEAGGDNDFLQAGFVALTSKS